MANPLFQLFGDGQPSNPVMQMIGSITGNNQNLANMQQNFDSFKSTVQGDPKAKVQELIDSGQMSREQFNMLSQAANALRGYLK